MTVPNNAQLKLVQEINLPDSVVANNIFYFEADFTDPQQVGDVIDSLVTWIEEIYTEIISEMSPNVTLGDMTLYEYDVVLDQWDNLGTGAPARTFTGATDMLPHGVSALVRAYSSEARSIGRKYIPAFVEAEQVDGAWAAGALTSLAGFGTRWAALKTISAGNDLMPGVFSTKFKTIFRLTGVTVVLTNCAYQRRRRPGVGS